MALCIAVVGKENCPLFVKTVPGTLEDELRFHSTVYTSLDVVEERMTAAGKSASDPRDIYLGLLYPNEDYKIYGYVTNTKIKFIIVVDAASLAVRDNEIRAVFRRLHSAYTNMVCNPFYQNGDIISSRAFTTVASSMLKQD